MLQKEFEERVGFKVSASEYGTIETLYNESDLDKDVFCAKWKKNDRMEMAELNANTITTLNKRIFSRMPRLRYRMRPSSKPHTSLSTNRMKRMMSNSTREQ